MKFRLINIYLKTNLNQCGKIYGILVLYINTKSVYINIFIFNVEENKRIVYMTKLFHMWEISIEMSKKVFIYKRFYLSINLSKVLQRLRSFDFLFLEVLFSWNNFI